RRFDLRVPHRCAMGHTAQYSQGEFLEQRLRESAEQTGSPLLHESFDLDIISSRRPGVLPGIARAGLSVLTLPYRPVIALRNAYYNRWALPRWLDVPVVSVGNITVGGTGKTPMVIWLCERLLERGRKPAVLSRGYKSQGRAA